jgi:hypothetical protein
MRVRLGKKEVKRSGEPLSIPMNVPHDMQRPGSLEHYAEVMLVEG